MTIAESNAPGSESTPRRGWIWPLVIVLLAVGAGAGYYTFFKRPPPGTVQSAADSSKPGPGKDKGRFNMAGRAMPVIVAPARSGDVNVILSGLGSVTPLATVIVRSRIDGQLMRVAFKEGQMVRAGDLLAEIDPRPYRVQLATAEGQMARDQALLRNARIDLARYRTLLEQDSIAKQQLDTQEALVFQYEGVVRIDQAAIDNAKLQLAYCRIIAPIGGRLGLREVDSGNIVRAGDPSGLVVIAQQQPIAVIFTIPEDSLPPVMARLRAGAKLAVDAYDRADKVKLASGVLLTADNRIDPATGTVKLKAQFANADNVLFPSQFVNVRMLLDVRHDATLIPGAAVQRGTPGTYVYIVKPDSTVGVRKVKLGPTQGEYVAVESGLAPGDRVVIDGADKLREGAKVEATTTVARAAANAPRKKTAQGGGQALSPEERKRRWEQINARIERGEFGEDVKKMSQEDRIKHMRELRRQRDAASQ